MIARVYIDTSVIGGCFDDMFREASAALFSRFRSGLSIAVVSDLTELELSEAPPQVLATLEDVPDAFKESVALTAEAAELAEGYIAAGVLGEAKRVDAQHIAIATVHRVDVLVSWNFRHIVNLSRIRGFNSVNLRWGHPMLEIRTPQEVIDHDED